MKLTRLTTLVLTAMLVAPAVASAQAGKPAGQPAAAAKVGPAAKLPPAILAAFQQAYPNATIKAAAKETENGKTVWEVESIDNNLSRDLIYNPDGTVVEIEEEVPAVSLPAVVTAAVTAKHPKATITKAEKTTAGQKVWYELALKGAAVKTIELTPEGTPVLAAKEGREDSPTVSAADGPYKLLAEIKAGGDGGWDYLAVDSANHRLYVSHATKVVVIDLDANTVVGEIAPAPGVHGIAVAPELARAFVSNGRENSASVVDLKTLQITGSVKTGENPDCILYEPAHKEVYTFNGRGKSATVFDAVTGDVRATIPLPGKPEFAVLDVKAGRIYNNIEDTSEVVVIDTSTHAVVANWPIAPGEEASGLAIDLVNHRLFAVASNKLLVALDSQSGKVLSTLPIGPGVDAAAYDPTTGLVFASSSDSTLTVAKADAAGKLSLVQTLATPPRSRTMTLDKESHRIYVSAAEFTTPPPPAAGAQPARPQMVPGSFKVVVYGTVPLTKR
jgi:DNA-binding beta-propeller fold protein YncE